MVPCPSPALLARHEVSFRLDREGLRVAFYDFKRERYDWATLDAGLEETAKTVNAKTTDANVTTAAAAVTVLLNRTAPGGWARFALAGVGAEDGGLYRCSAKVLNPPPVKTLCDAPTVDLRLEGRLLLHRPGLTPYRGHEHERYSSVD